MQDYAIDKTFKYGDKTYLVAKPPRTFWKCQNCAFFDLCEDLFGTMDFPACMSDTRRDKTSVVFFEVDEPREPRYGRRGRYGR